MSILTEIRNIFEKRTKKVLPNGTTEYIWITNSFQHKWILFLLFLPIIGLGYALWEFHQSKLTQARADERKLTIEQEALLLPKTIADRDSARQEATQLRLRVINLDGKLKIKTEEAEQYSAIIDDLQSKLSAASDESREFAKQIDALTTDIHVAQDQKQSKIAAEARTLCGENKAELQQKILDAETECASQIRNLKQQTANASTELPSMKSIRSKAFQTLTFVEGDQWRRIDGSLLAVTSIDSSELTIRTDNANHHIRLNDEDNYGYFSVECKVRVLKLIPSASPPTALVEHWCKE